MRRRVEDALDLLGHRRAASTAPSARCRGGQQQRVAIGVGAHRRAPRAGARRADVRARPGRGGGGAGRAHPARARPRAHRRRSPSIASNGWCSTPTGWSSSTSDGAVRVGEPRSSHGRPPVAPPVVELGGLAGWRPLPLSVRDARRAAGPLRERLDAVAPPRPDRGARSTSAAVVTMRRLSARYGRNVVLRDIALERRRGRGRRADGTQRRRQVHAARPSRRCSADRRRVSSPSTALDPPRSRPAMLVRSVGLVPPDPSALLYEQTVHEEAVAADRSIVSTAGTTLATLESLGLPPGRRASPARPVRGTTARARNRRRHRARAAASSCSTSRPAGSTTTPSAI